MLLAVSLASCVAYGVPAVCRSPEVDRQALVRVMRWCPKCDRERATAWIDSYQQNRGPYDDVRLLYEDVRRAIEAERRGG